MGTAIHVCHDHTSPNDRTPIHPNTRRHFGVSRVCVGRLVGDVRQDDTGRRGTPRRLEVEVDAPRPPLAAQASFRYLEWWSRDGRGWFLVRYQYDYLDRFLGGRLAYHRHDLADQPDIPHMHCMPTGRPPTVRHFRSYEVDLIESHEEFAALYLGDRGVDCVGLRPLHIHRQGADA